ncbi:MAG: trypsin-like serine protease [Spirulinaceae cyanobacterium SM2_1_0]|nr:trypsin-like serine protease [Spirulinaceae cyanobacterium SM2_1_0]
MRFPSAPHFAGGRSRPDAQRPQPLAIVVPTDDPNDPRFLVPPGSGYDGVVRLEFPDDGICTGALLRTGRHILTAAHCFEAVQQTGIPNLFPSPDDVSVSFDLPTGSATLAAASVAIHPEWDNTENYNNDLAIIELVQLAPAQAERYALYRRRDEVGQMITRVGYGVRGTGRTGEDPNDETTLKRLGMNRYDTLGDTLNEPPLEADILPGTQLVYDFDNGLRRNDALGVEYGLHDLGVIDQMLAAGSLTLGASEARYTLLSLEVGTSTGDSGGPSFIRGQIAGIASNGYSPDTPGVDVTAANDTSFGEYFFDTRVSAYTDFIDAVLATTHRPSAQTLMLGGTWGLSSLPLLLAVVLASRHHVRRAIARCRQTL